MKRLFIEILIASSLFLCVIFFLEIKYKNYDTKADELIESFQSSANSAEVLMVGNSHVIAVYEGLKDRSGDRVSLLGLGGLDIFQMRNLTTIYARQMKNLKLIMISADEYCLGNNLKTSNFLYVDRMLYRYTDTLYEQSLSASLMAKSNFMRSNRDLSFLFSSSSINHTEEDAVITDDPMSKANCHNRAIELTEKRFQKSLYEENRKLFTELLQNAAGTGAKVVVVSLPKSGCYNLNKNSINTREGNKMLKSLTERENIPYYNLTSVDSMDDSQFKDADHVNKKGALRFVQIMDSLLREDAVVQDFASMVFGN